VIVSRNQNKPKKYEIVYDNNTDYEDTDYVDETEYQTTRSRSYSNRNKRYIRPGGDVEVRR
jgi:hypothetical protein